MAPEVARKTQGEESGLELRHSKLKRGLKPVP